ncbi:MAG: cytochrome P450 [Egibacteraceae bacterium]
MASGQGIDRGTALFLQLFDPAHRADPYPVCRRILEECPVFEGPFDAVVLSRYADCAAVFRDPRASSDQRHSTTYQNAAASGELDPMAQASLERPSFLFLDPPDHTRLRRLVSKAFTPRVVEALRPTVQRWVDELIDRVAENHRIELIADLAYPLPVRVICRMLGVPTEDLPKFRAWARELERGLDPVETLSADEQDRMVRALEALTGYFNELIARRRAEPAADDLLSALIAVEEQGDQLTTAELNATCRLLLLAGHVTTVNLIANGMLALLRHPDQLERLRLDRSLTGTAVEEVLRYDPPVQFAGRVAREPLEIGGTTISPGQRIVLLLAAAERDPARFVDPDRFDIARANNAHLTFGAGIHFCLGAPLARLEGQVALSTLATRLVDPMLEADPPPYKNHIVLRGPESLPITFSDVKPV